VPSVVVKLWLGMFLLCYVGLSVWRPQGVTLPKTPATLVGGGVASGFVAGLIGTGGAIRSMCLMAFGLPRDAYIGTSAAIALVVDATRIPVYVTEQFIPGRMVPVVVSLIGAAFAGAWVGRRLVQRVSPVAFQRFVLAMLALMGTRFLWEGGHGLAVVR